MSVYEWERGTIKLPTAEVTKVKKAVRDAVNMEHDRIYTQARDWWRKNGRKALAKKREHEKGGRPYAKDLHELTEGLDDAVAMAIYEGVRKGKMPTHDDIEPKPMKSNTSSVWLGEASISFKGREVTWSVPENNHACERAREHPTAVALFAALDRVKWTRGSGGQIVGNNEYHRDSTEAGGGANYVVDEYGPKIKRRVALGRRW